VTRVALEAKVSKRVNDAVAKAVAESEARQARQTQELLAASDKRHALETQAMIVRVDQYIEVEKKLRDTSIVASNEAGSANGDAR
jgi:hypothetical protein